MAAKAKKTAARAADPQDRVARPVRSAPTLVSPTVALNGSLDRADPDGSVEGWCWSPDEPLVHRTLAVLIDGAEVMRLTADLDRPDLAAAGVGNGRHAFRGVLDPALRRAGDSVAVALRDVRTGQPVGAPVTVQWRGAATAAPAAELLLAGHLDRVSRDGWVSGWCWYPERPTEHVELTVLVDDLPVGTVRADAHRPDLQQAGIGDGTHGFSFALPYAALAERGTLTVAVQESRSGRNLSDPITMRLGRLAAAEERIQDLERSIRLLRGQLDEVRRRAEAHNEDRAARSLFGTVAAFFHDLAQGDGAPTLAGASLAATLAEVTARWSPLVLAVPERPIATLCLAATAPLDAVRDCLGALHAAGLDRQADIVVLDDGGQGAGMALLPAIVRNLRYVFQHDGAGLVAGRGEVAAAACTDLVAFLSPACRPAADWLEQLAATLADAPEAALVGGRLLREDGLLQHAGLLAAEAGGLHDPARLAAPDVPEFRFRRKVDAVSGHGFAMRRAALVEAGGFSPLFRRFGHAVADLCARLPGAVVYQPAALARFIDLGPADDAAPPDMALPDEETLRLAERLHAGWPAPVGFVGHALVIDDHPPRPLHDAGSIATWEQMRILRRLGWRVTFAPLHAAELPPATVDELGREGIELAVPPHFASVTDYLTAAGAALDLVHIYRYGNAAMLLERVRALAPRARVVFATADLHHLRERRSAEMQGQNAPAATREAELRCMHAADATIITSDYEHALLRADVDAERLVLLRWIARTMPPTQGFAARRDICFVGNFRHPPNLDGIDWFIREVLPLVRARLPGVRLKLAGGDMSQAVRELEGEAVEVVGWVRDLAALFGEVRLSVAPLRYGAGFKGKVATSLAHGLPVVGSSISLEGTGLSDGDGVAVADDPADFAAAVVRLYEDAGLWAAQSARALERVEALYAPAAAEAVWRDMLTRLGLPAAP